MKHVARCEDCGRKVYVDSVHARCKRCRIDFVPPEEESEE